eukprot:g25063.t1
MGFCTVFVASIFIFVPALRLDGEAGILKLVINSNRKYQKPLNTLFESLKAVQFRNWADVVVVIGGSDENKIYSVNNITYIETPLMNFDLTGLAMLYRYRTHPLVHASSYMYILDTSTVGPTFPQRFAQLAEHFAQSATETSRAELAELLVPPAPASNVCVFGHGLVERYRRTERNELRWAKLQAILLLRDGRFLLIGTSEDQASIQSQVTVRACRVFVADSLGALVAYAQDDRSREILRTQLPGSSSLSATADFSLRRVKMPRVTVDRWSEFSRFQDIFGDWRKPYAPAKTPAKAPRPKGVLYSYRPTAAKPTEQQLRNGMRCRVRREGEALVWKRCRCEGWDIGPVAPELEREYVEQAWREDRRWRSVSVLSLRRDSYYSAVVSQLIDLDVDIGRIRVLPSNSWYRSFLEDHMIAWGGENIDQSLRSWLCGGRIEIAEGAFVAHMWRDPNNPKTKLKYTMNTEDVMRNKAHPPEDQSGANLCLTLQGEKLSMEECAEEQTQVFRLKTMEEVAKVILRKDLCLDAGQGKGVVAYFCDKENPNQAWSLFNSRLLWEDGFFCVTQMLGSVWLRGEA